MFLRETSNNLKVQAVWAKNYYDPWSDILWKSVDVQSDIMETIESSSIKGDSLKDISSKGEKIKLEKAQTLKIQSVDYRVI